jgi:hypothetical protein
MTAASLFLLVLFMSCFVKHIFFIIKTMFLISVQMFSSRIHISSLFVPISRKIVRVPSLHDFLASIFAFVGLCIFHIFHSSFLIYRETRCMPVRCYGHLIMYKATHKIYNKNFSIEGITSEERLEIERIVTYVNLVICPSDYDKYSQNDTLRLFKINVVMRLSYCLQCLVGLSPSICFMRHKIDEEIMSHSKTILKHLNIFCLKSKHDM